MNCTLCRAEKLTHWHHEDTICWVADCKTCGVLMAVWKQHGRTPPEEVKQHMISVLTKIKPGGRIDYDMRAIPNHYHIHSR